MGMGSGGQKLHGPWL